MNLCTHNLHLTLKGMSVLVTVAFKILKQFYLNFSEGNLATKQVVFLQRPVMWNSAVQTPEVSNMLIVLNKLVLHIMVRYRNILDLKINGGGKSSSKGFHLKQVCGGLLQLNSYVWSFFSEVYLLN